MPREFKYDAIHLIEAVRDRPCLWDKTQELYKDRTERRSAWEEVFRLLDETYDDMDCEEQRLTGDRIITKWTNMRDTFVKSLRRIPGQPPKRRYVLHSHLAFLLKGKPNEDDYTEQESHQTAEDTQYLKIEGDSASEDESFIKKRKKERASVRQSRPKIEPEFAEIDSYNDPRVMNEDEAFFASLLPSVVSYSEDERLEFRIEVLALMRRIKDKRNNIF